LIENSSTHFEFLDGNPFNGQNYYRIKSIDFDNSINYSNVFVAECNDKKKVEVRLFPNPANPDAIAFNVNGPLSGNVDVHLYDAFGRKIEAQILTLPNCIFVPKTTLVSGIYYLIIQQDDWRKVLKVNVK
jgi:hypothetical protein